MDRGHAATGDAGGKSIGIRWTSAAGWRHGVKSGDRVLFHRVHAALALLDERVSRVLVFGGRALWGRGQRPCVDQQSLWLWWGSPQGSSPLLLGVFVEVYLKFTLLANLVCVSHRCGKTTICQVFAALANQKLYSVNCHLHMETSDFLGGLRPVRKKPNDKVCPEQVMMFCSSKELKLALYSSQLWAFCPWWGVWFQIWYVSYLHIFTGLHGGSMSTLSHKFCSLFLDLYFLQKDPFTRGHVLATCVLSCGATYSLSYPLLFQIVGGNWHIKTLRVAWWAFGSGHEGGWLFPLRWDLTGWWLCPGKTQQVHACKRFALCLMLLLVWVL